MGIQIISDSAYVKSDWTGGTSTQFFIYPSDSTLANRDFLFRISSARIDVEVSEFSNFEGFQRIFLPLRGNVVIQHKDGAPIFLDTNEILKFDGGLITNSKGKCVDFNVIYRPELDADVEVFSLKKGDKLTLDMEKRFDFLFLYAHLGEVQSSDGKLKKGETVKMDSLSPALEWTATEESTLLLSRISLKKD